MKAVFNGLSDQLQQHPSFKEFLLNSKDVGSGIEFERDHRVPSEHRNAVVQDMIETQPSD